MPLSRQEIFLFKPVLKTGDRGYLLKKKTHKIKKYFKGNHHPNCYLEVSVYSDISTNEHLGRQTPQ